MKPTKPIRLSPGNSPSAPAAPRESSSEWAILAGLRFVLAFIVLCGHISTMFVGNHDWTYFGRWLNQEGSVFGFFLISGYSIAASLERSTKGFYQRRIERIWPLYIATIVLGLVSMYVCGFQGTSEIGYSQSDSGLRDVLGTLLMLQAILTTPVGFIGTTWTLSLEWWYYMVAPALRRTPDWLLWALVCLSACGFVYASPVSYKSAPLLTMAWLWILGFLYHRLKDRKYAPLALCLPCMLVMGAAPQATLHIQTAATVAALIFCRGMRIPSAALAKVLNYLGDVSYPLYLVQFPILWMLTKAGVTNSMVLAAACALASIVLVHAVDYPCRRRAARVRDNARILTVPTST